MSESKEIVAFEFPETNQRVRQIMINNEPWFVAKDVCVILELGNSRRATSRLDDDEKGVTTINTLGGLQEMVIINESGLYSLILTSRKPEAKKFQRWITHEVIPQIRKTGAYSVKRDNLEILLENVKELIAIRDRVKAVEETTEDHEIRLQQVEDVTQTSTGYLTITAFVRKYAIKVPSSVPFSKIGKAMMQYCKENDIEVRSIPHSQWGQVKAYQESALISAFREMGLTVTVIIEDDDED